MIAAFRSTSRATWRVCLVALLTFAALATPACKRKSSATAGALGPQTSLFMGDPRNAAQLLNGFHSIEAGAWRWTAQQFGVMLRTPPGAAQNGAILEFKLTVPDPVIAKLGKIALIASIGDMQFPPETYVRPGDYTYAVNVPPQLVSGEAAIVKFSLDNAMPPNPPDLRTLGVVAHNIALRSRPAP
jgi:hypothetical protein